MKKEASYIPNKMIIRSIKGLNAETRALTLEFDNKKVAKEFTFEPGQFVLVSLPGYGEIALSITSSKVELPLVEIAVRTTGVVSKAINGIAVGEEIYLRGPYGNSFPFEKIKGKEIILVAGGIGLAPLRSLVKTLIEEKYSSGKLKLFIGAKKPEDFIYKVDLKKWEKDAEVNLAVNTCDADWKGCVGYVTDLMNKIKFDEDSIAILCGPPSMYLPVIEKLTKAGLNEKQIYFMLERRMKCGIGKCQHCTCGDKYVCLDGPTFCWEEIKDNWESLV